MSINVGEFGDEVILDAREVIAAFTPEIIFRDPAGFQYTKPAQIGTEDRTTELIGDVLANQYVTYTTQPQDFPRAGRWYMRLSLRSSGHLRLSDWKPFYVTL